VGKERFTVEKGSAELSFHRNIFRRYSMIDAVIIDQIRWDERRRGERGREPGSDNTDSTIIDYRITMPINRGTEGLYSSRDSR